MGRKDPERRSKQRELVKKNADEHVWVLGWMSRKPWLPAVDKLLEAELIDCRWRREFQKLRED